MEKQVNSLAEAYLQVCEQYPTPDYASMSDAEFDALVRKSGNPEGLIARRKNQQERAAIERTRRGYTAADAKADQEKAKVEAENRRRSARGEDPLPVPGGSQLKNSRPAVAPTAPQKSARQQELDAINADKTLTPMEKWAKANPKLAAAKAERDRTRGTSASTNPMLDRNKKVPGLRSGMPTPAASSTAKPGSSASLSSAPKNDLAKGSTPIVVNRSTSQQTSSAYNSGSSMAQRLQAIRSMQARSQSRTAVSPNQQSSLNSTVKSGTSQVPTGNTVKTKMNPDSSMKVTQKRTPAETARIKKSLDIQSADLFDIIQGEFIEEGYTQEDTVYMMANLNEEQLQEFMKYVQGAINVGKRIPGIRGAINRVGAMFNRAPKQMPAGQVGALRLYQDKANQSMQRLNQQTTRLNARDAQREANRLKNLNPTAVSDRNRREAAAQMRQRNRELGRPESAGVQPVDRLDYKPGDPMFDDFVKRHHADKRGGVVKFTDGARRIDK